MVIVVMPAAGDPPTVSLPSSVRWSGAPPGPAARDVWKSSTVPGGTPLSNGGPPLLDEPRPLDEPVPPLDELALPLEDPVPPDELPPFPPSAPEPELPAPPSSPVVLLYVGEDEQAASNA